MATGRRGQSVPVTPGRRLVAELMRQSRHVPLVTVRREFSVPALADVRAEGRPRISWVALFGRAYALVAQKHVHLRRSWISFPYGRIYEHPVSEGVVLVEREWQGEELVLGAKLRAIEEMPLPLFNRHLRRFRTEPLHTISPFRQQLRIARYPALVRRFNFWAALHVSGPRRCHRFGTFMISSLGNFGCELLAPPMPLTGYLTYGPVSPDGAVTVNLAFDHRVMDGRHAGRALEDLERVMNTTILTELQRATVPEQIPDTPLPSPEPAAADEFQTA